MKRIIILCFTFVFLLNACSSEGPFVLIEDKKIDIEIATTDEERVKGLMFRENLCQNCGMLFVFEEEKPLSFWMKNTLIPLSIIFIDSDLNIVDIKNASPCITETCPSYPSNQTAKYVLEINQNIFNQNIIGSKIEINY